MGIFAKCEYCPGVQAKTIGEPDIGTAALSPYSITCDGGAERGIHKAGLDE